MPKACRKQNTINPHASRLGNDNPPYRSDKELLAWFMKQLRDNPALWNGLDADTANDAQVEVTGRSSKPSRSQSGASGAKYVARTIRKHAGCRPTAAMCGSNRNHRAGRGAGKPQGSVWDLYAAVDEQNTLVERALPLGSDMLLARDTVEQLVIQSGRQTQVRSCMACSGARAVDAYLCRDTHAGIGCATSPNARCNTDGPNRGWHGARQPHAAVWGGPYSSAGGGGEGEPAFVEREQPSAFRCSSSSQPAADVRCGPGVGNGPQHGGSW